MIDLEEVIADPDMTQPEPFVIQRYAGAFVPGGFQNVLTAVFQQTGPVRNATDKEVAMLAEADRTSQVRAFFTSMQVLTAHGASLIPSVHGETPQGTGSTFTLSAAPPGGVGQLTINGKFQTPGVDYTLIGTAITLTTAVDPSAVLWFQWPALMPVGTNESDIISYNNEMYRVLAVYRVSGSGYWKSLGTRMATS